MAMYDPWLQSTQAKLLPNESTNPTLKPLRVDRASALREAAPFTLAIGAWGLGAVTLRKSPILDCSGDDIPF